eukprot:scaffold24451_cov62-Phaeocystis_antarctica.AAC.3
MPSELEFERKKGRAGVTIACPRMSAAVATTAGPYGQERDDMVDIVCCRRTWARRGERRKRCTRVYSGYCNSRTSRARFRLAVPASG